MNTSILRLTYSDVCKGYSRVFHDAKPYFIKHLSHHDQVDVEARKEQSYLSAKKRGVLTEQEKLALLERRGIWTKDNENGFVNQRVYVENLEKSKKHYPIKSQLEAHKKLIEEERQKYNVIALRRENLIDLTCEKYADKKMDDYYLYLALFSDESLTKKLFTMTEFDDLDDEDMDVLYEVYTSGLSRLSMTNIKKVAIADFFIPYLNVCGDSPHLLFGKPICDLTYNQLNLISYATYFRSIKQAMQNIPEDVAEDPDKLEEHYTMNSKAKESLEKINKRGDGGLTSFVGGTAQDYKDAGLQTIDMYKKIQETQGKMNINDLIKITQA